MNITHKALIILSAIVWYAGGINLLLKGRRLLLEAVQLAPDALYHWPVLLFGLSLGVFKAALLFSKNCRKNIIRIHALDNPRIWQFFRPRFFILLAVMISAGFLMTHLARGSYWGLLAVAALDFSISTALLISSRVFWQRDEKY